MGMLQKYTAVYTKLPSGRYLGQLAEWQEVITEGMTLEECKEMLADALEQMILAYKETGQEVPTGHTFIEAMAVNV